jgi:hypothetical protein
LTIGISKPALAGPEVFDKFVQCEKTETGNQENWGFWFRLRAIDFSGAAFGQIASPRWVSVSLSIKWLIPDLLASSECYEV